MDRYTRKLSLMAGKMNPTHLRLIVVLISLILFVIGAGAPEGSSGPGSG
jgi:hypothetical protein